LQREVEAPLSKRLLAGEYKPGDVMLISVENDKLAFSKVEKMDVPSGLSMESTVEG